MPVAERALSFWSSQLPLPARLPRCCDQWPLFAWCSPSAFGSHYPYHWWRPSGSENRPMSTTVLVLHSLRMRVAGYKLQIVGLELVARAAAMIQTATPGAMLDATG